MSSKNFVIRQGTIKLFEITPPQGELLGVTTDGLVVTTGIPSGAIGDLQTDVASISAAVGSLVAASSGAIATINNIAPENLNINLVSPNTEVTIGANSNPGEVQIDIDFSDYATVSLVDGISGVLAADITTIQTDITNIQTDIVALSAAIGAIEPESTILVSGNGISASEGPTNTWTISVTGDYAELSTLDNYTTLATTASISADLQQQINSIVPESTVISSSGGSITVTQDGTTWNVEVASAPIQDHNDLNNLQGGNSVDEYYHLSQSQFDDYIGETEVAGISANLQGQIDAIVVPTSADFVGAFVRITGDTMTGPLVIDSTLTVEGVTVLNGDLYVNGTQFVVDTETVSTSSNLIVLNNGEVGPGVTAGFAGIEVDRGSLTNYQFIFDETDDSFKVGEIGDLQKVATREDTPTPGGYAVWNASENRFDTVTGSSIAAEISGTFVNIAGDIMTGDLTVQADVIIENGSLQIDGSSQTYAENLDATSGQEIVDQFANTLGNSAQWLVSIKNDDNTALRTSVVVASWFGATIDWNETSTNDIIGSTEDVTLDVVIAGSDVQLRAVITGLETWIIKAHRILI